MIMKIKNIFHRISMLIVLLTVGLLMNNCGPSTSGPGSNLAEEVGFNYPDHGFVSFESAGKWEESMITGNGTFGALVPGDPLNERIILSHEKLFMPEYFPTDAPPLHKHMDKIKELTLQGKGEEASELALELGKEVGIDDLIWTDPLVPACQLEIVDLSGDKVQDYLRSVDYETGEANTIWKAGGQAYKRSIFISRADGIGVMRITGTGQAGLNFKFRMNQLPLPGEDEEWEDELNVDELIQEVRSGADGSSVYYTTTFKKQWEGSLKGYNVKAAFYTVGGSLETDEDWLSIKDAGEILVLMDIKLSYDLPLEPVTPLSRFEGASYDELLAGHEEIHSEMFNRFSLEIAGSESDKALSSEELLESSSFGALNPALVNQLCEASRYSVISSSGQLPPTLQGIWGGTWRPAWSGDFTLNGNVPSAIACGLNCNIQELTESYLGYMWSMWDDFEDNARDLYDAPGIFVPSRSSSSGKTYHYLDYYPHLFWYAGATWTSQFFYDYWQYTSDETFLKERAIPFMMASAEFCEFFLTEGDDGLYHFIPSYSPEIGPEGYHPVVMDAVMDIAALKQLMRNLLKLVELGWIEEMHAGIWSNILVNLPEYDIDESGDLREWLWPGFKNDNSHRHASHLYPLFYEVDPDFEDRPELKEAAAVAIENRLQYRRDNNGAEMAFGLVQKGLAAAHIRDTEHAYECVDWLCNSYWSPSFTAYHDPGEIFNVDICGGLPAVVAEMIIQSSAKHIELLPALPDQWPDGSIKGSLTRCGVTVDLDWSQGKPVQANLIARENTSFRLTFGDESWLIELEQGQELHWEYQ